MPDNSHAVEMPVPVPSSSSWMIERALSMQALVTRVAVLNADHGKCIGGRDRVVEIIGQRLERDKMRRRIQF